MKTIFIIVSIAISFSVTAQNFSIGPTAGFGHSWITHITNYYNSTYTRKFNPAWNTGLSFIYSTKKHFGLGIDVKYSAEGNKAHTHGFFSGDVGAAAGTSIYHINYIRIPVKFIYFFGKTGNAVRPKIYIGPDFGFSAELKNVFKVDGGDTFKAKANNEIKNFDVGTIAACGMNIRLKHRVWLNTDAAWYYGLEDILKDYTPANPRTGKNGNVELNIGVLFGLTK